MKSMCNRIPRLACLAAVLTISACAWGPDDFDTLDSIREDDRAIRDVREHGGSWGNPHG